MPQYLENRGYKVYAMDFSEWDSLPYASVNLKDLRYVAAVIGRQIIKIKAETNQPKVNVIAHSIAGLAVRAYIADWGQEIDDRGRYKNDINKILYLNTPQYGFEKFTTRLRRMLRETDWGSFYPSKNEQRFYNDLKFGSKAMADLMLATRELHTKYNIEEVTVATRGDEFIKELHLASLVGLSNQPMFIPRPSVASNYSNIDNHLALTGFAHASSKYNGSPQSTLINVSGKNHPTYKIARLFFANEPAWKTVSGGKNTSKNITFIALDKNSPISFKNFDTTKLAMFEVKPNRRKRVSLDYLPDSDMYMFEDESSGTYQLEILGDNGLPIRFDLHLIGGVAQVLELAEDAFAPDPAYEKEGMDDHVGLGDIPAEIKDYSTLRQFVLATFPFESRVFKDRKSMVALANDVKELLHATYPNLIRRSSVDIFGLSDELRIDWITGVDSEGIFANKLAWSEIKIVKEIPDPGDGGGGGDDGGDYPDSPPKDVYNLPTLKEFTLWYLKGDAYKHYHEKRIPAAMVRDALDARYSNIVKLNDGQAHPGYYAPYDRHRDAFFLLDKQQIIDFVGGSSDPGPLYPSLGWLIQSVTPW